MSEKTLCQLERLLVEMQARPSGASTRRVSRRKVSVRRTCSITWLAWTTSKAPSSNGRPSSRSAPTTSMPRLRATAACSSISSIPHTLAAPRRSATRIVNSPRCVPRSSSRAPRARLERGEDRPPVLLLGRPEHLVEIAHSKILVDGGPRDQEGHGHAAFRPRPPGRLLRRGAGRQGRPRLREPGHRSGGRGGRRGFHQPVDLRRRALRGVRVGREQPE